MNNCSQNTTDSGALARCLTDRYGPLALSRAAGEAAYAERRGDRGRSAFLRGVINDLRRTVVTPASVQT
jgi:hypothetical protein